MGELAEAILQWLKKNVWNLGQCPSKIPIINWFRESLIHEIYDFSSLSDFWNCCSTWASCFHYLGGWRVIQSSFKIRGCLVASPRWRAYWTGLKRVSKLQQVQCVGREKMCVKSLPRPSPWSSFLGCHGVPQVSPAVMGQITLAVAMQLVCLKPTELFF